MGTLLLEHLVRSSALAASSRADVVEDRSLVIEAARGCRQAAALGCRLPLFVMLDVAAALGNPLIRRGLPQRSQTKATAAYDQWVADFCVTALGQFRTVASQVLDGEVLPLREVPAVVPLLVKSWPGPVPGGLGGCHEWSDTCRAIAADAAAIAQVVSGWSGARATGEKQWGLWWSPPPEQRVDAWLPGAIWGRFVSAHPQAWLHEQFDHAAAAVYFATVDPAGLSELLSRRQRIDRPHPSPWPLPSPPVLQDPDEGPPALMVLVLGEYGVFKWYNSPPRQASPLPSPPPDILRVHLAWVVGRKGVSQELSWGPLSLAEAAAGSPGKPPASKQPAWWLPQASVLQGFIGLVLDDWRSVVAGQRTQVRFHLHRDWPPAASAEAATADVGLPGKRWKRLALEPQGVAPPASAMGLLFERCSHVAVAMEPLRWPDPAPSGRNLGGWWCGFVLRADLEDLDFQPVTGIGDQPGAAPSAWEGPRNALPQRMTNLIVLDPPDRCVGIYHVPKEALGCGPNRDPRNGEEAKGKRVPKCRLRLINAEAAAGKPDESFALARRAACQLFLSVLISRGYI